MNQISVIIKVIRFSNVKTSVGIFSNCLRLFMFKIASIFIHFASGLILQALITSSIQLALLSVKTPL